MSVLPRDIADIPARLKYDANGLVCAVVQDAGDARVLMVAWMNEEAVSRTLLSGYMTYWSRSRQEYWRKGDTSGHYQLVRGVQVDCDADALLFQVEQIGAACHTGSRSCFDAGPQLAHRFVSTGDFMDAKGLS